MSSNLLNAMNWRYSTKQFDSNQKITQEQIEVLKETLRLSPSSFGLQPWHFVIVSDQAILNDLVEACFGQEQVGEASHLFVLCRPDRMDAEWVERYLEAMAEMRSIDRASLEPFCKVMLGFVDSKTDLQLERWMEEQVYIALGTLLTACALESIDACPMGGFDPAKVDLRLGLGEQGLKSVVLCPVGIRSDNDKYSRLPKVRFPSDNLFTSI